MEEWSFGNWFEHRGVSWCVGIQFSGIENDNTMNTWLQSFFMPVFQRAANPFKVFLGGEGTWREYLTLPNILKEFNPRLTGYSTGTGEFLSPNSQLNVAFPVAADADALRQAKILVSRLKQSSRVNMTEDWKMVTVFFGANDLCSGQCYDKKGDPQGKHATRLMAALDYLQNNLPRTFVNLIPALGKILRFNSKHFC